MIKSEQHRQEMNDLYEIPGALALARKIVRLADKRGADPCDVLDDLVSRLETPASPLA